MNTQDIITYWRSNKKLKDESDIATPEMLRLVNLGYNFVGQFLYPIFSDDLVIELPAGAFSSTQTLYAPDDSLTIIDVYRETSGGTGIYKQCHKVDVENKTAIGNDPNFPIRAEYPYYVHEGKKILIYPSFPVAPLTPINIKILYRKRLADLIIGSSTTTTASDTLTLDVLASIRNDIYNGYDMAIIKKNTAADNAWELEKILKVDDYVGATRICSFRGTSGNDEFAAATEYRYALYPYIPEEYHNFILDAVKIELVKAERLVGNPDSLELSLIKRMTMTLQSTGFGHLIGRQD